MVLFLNKKKLQEQKPLVNKTYQGKYDYSGMPLLQEDYRYGFDSLVELGGIKPETAYMLGKVESNFKPDAIGLDPRDKGLFQLNQEKSIDGFVRERQDYNPETDEYSPMPSVWKELSSKYLSEEQEFDPFIPVHNSIGAGWHISETKKTISNKLGRPATDEDVLFAHKTGATGYARDIKRGIASDGLKTRYRHLVEQGYTPSFIIDKDGKIIKKDNKLSLLERITPIAEAEEIQTDRKPIEEIFAKKDVERIKFDYQINKEAERLNKPLNIAMRTVTGIPKHAAIIGKEIGQSIMRNALSFFSAETLSPLVGKLQNIQKRLEENNITYGFFAEEMRDRLLGDLSSDEVVELTGETRGEQVVPAEQRIENLKNKLKEKANTYREKAKDENGIAKLVHETLADVLSTEGGALGLSSTLVLGSIALDLTGYGGTKNGLTKALKKSDNIIDAARVLMRAGLDEKTALSFADDVVKIRTTKAANSFINNLEVTLKTTKPVSKRIPLGEIIKKESNIEDVIFQEAKKYKSAEEFVKAQGKGLPSSWFDYRSKIPNVKGGWTKDKIVKHLKNVGSDYKQTTFNKEILKFDNPQELEQNLFYHGSGRSIGSLKPSITMTERQAEMFGGGGYGERYWGISLSKDRNMASAFTGQARSGEVAPVILKKGAKVKSMPEIQDAVELEDHIVRLWDEGVDAVKIGDWKSEFSEQELVVLNPKAIVVGKGDYFPVYQKPKMPSFDEKKINEMFQEALPNWKKLREEERRIFVDNFKAKYGREPAPNNANDIILDEYFKTKSQLEDIWNKAQTIQNISETTTKKILTSAKETPIEFGLGKGVVQEKIISNEAFKLNDLLNRAKITKEESLELFNAFDNPQKYKLSQSLINKNGDDIIKEGRRLNSFLSEQKLSRGVIDRVYDDETYLRTVLETLDGKKPTAEQVARLKNATNQTFRDQLARDLTGFSGKLREKIKTDIRKYRTADERDVILESFGLRTKRDFVNSMSENIRLTTRATSNKEFNDAVRSIAKDGFWVKGKKLVKRDDIIEAYDPFVVSKTRQEIKNNTSKKVSKIIDEIKEERILTENEAKIIKDIIYEQKEEAIKELKDSHKYALDDIDNIINFTKQQIARVKNTLLDEKAILLERKTKLIENIRDEAKKELNDFYGKITIKRGELIDKGFKDAGSISGAEPLRGVMLNKKDYRALKEFVEELGESSLEDFAKTIKYFQATLDLFQIPQLLRSSISSSGLINGCWDWLKAVVKSSGVSVDDMVKSSEFVQQGRFKDFDIDIWNKQLKDMNDNTSWFMKQFKKLGKKTDNIPVVRDVLNGIGAIDEYQFQTVMIPLKTKAWLRKVDELKRLYPNLDERSIMVEAGRFIDDYFGGQQWDKLMARNPRLASRQNQRISRIMIFATDYLTSTMRKLKRETFDAFTKWGVPEGNMARKALAREIIFGLGLVNAISYMTRGKSAFENDDPNQFYKLQTNIKDGGGNPYYLDIMGNWGQAWNLINRPIDAIRGKISGIGKIGVSLLADGELKIGEALNPIPFSWRSILETAYNHALGRKPETQIPETIGGGALITLMEFMGLAGTFSGGKSRRQTLMRMIEAESFTPEEVWKYLTGQNVFTNKERITMMIEKDGISDAYSWELEQKKKGYLSEESYPTRDALKTKYGITGSITNNENILRINRMTKEEQRIFIEGYSEKTQELIKDKIKTGSYKKSLSDIFK